MFKVMKVCYDVSKQFSYFATNVCRHWWRTISYRLYDIVYMFNSVMVPVIHIIWKCPFSHYKRHSLLSWFYLNAEDVEKSFKRPNGRFKDSADTSVRDIQYVPDSRTEQFLKGPRFGLSKIPRHWVNVINADLYVDFLFFCISLLFWTSRFL